MRHICYVTGTRADFGLMQQTLMAIHSAPDLTLSLLITGMHLLPEYGHTVTEIEAAGFTILGRVPVTLSGGEGAEMSLALGEQIIGMTEIWQSQKPDMVLLLGDRGEMLAAAIAAIHLNIPVVHLHGGERSGTVDESVRHAISKLSHYHFTATEDAKARLIKMGELPEHIVVTGAPGLDAIYSTPLLEREQLCGKYGLDSQQNFQLILFHPVVQQAGNAEQQMQWLLEAAVEHCEQPLVIMPNADAGSQGIVRVIERFKNTGQVKTALHIPRQDYLSLMAHADVLIGNSSSGIIEAASLQTPVVNIGDRQNARERNQNVLDVPVDKAQIAQAIVQAKAMKGTQWQNCYGDGQSSARICQYLAALPITQSLLEKVNAY